MKRIGNLYEKICDIENLKLAHKNAKKGKRYYREVRMVDENIDEFINEIRDFLINRTFKNSEYEVFIKKCDRKVREIYKLPYYPDRIIHHAILQVLEPIWKNMFILDTYSCIKNRGIHFGFKRVKKSLKDVQGTRYCLKLDVKKYFPSVDNDILKEIVRKKIKDKELLWLLDEIIDSVEGLPIGNYLSQYLSNVYLTYFDHYCKEELKIKYFHRYCDDIVIFSSNKGELWKWFDSIKDYLDKELNLKIKNNHSLFPVESRGVDFLGYVFFHTHTLVRKSIKEKMKRKLRNASSDEKLRELYASYYGWLKHGDCKNLISLYLYKKD